MKKITMIVLIFLVMVIAPTSVFASVPANEKSVVVQDCIAKAIFDDDGFIPVEEAYFYGLRNVCEVFDYNVEWESSQSRAIVTSLNGKTLTDDNGNSIDTLVIEPRNVIELFGGESARLVQLPANYEPFIENNKLYVHSSIFEKYFGLKSVMDE